MAEGTEQQTAPGTDIIERLLAQGKKNGGTLTYGELIDALQKQDMSPDEMDDMYQRFSDEGVEIVDDAATAGEPAEEEPVWPDADLIRIIRGTENGNRIDGSLAVRLNGLRGFRLIDGPEAGSGVLPMFDGDAIFEWEEVVPVAKSAILAGLGTTDDNTDTDDVDDEEESEDEDEDECDGTCLACILRRLFAAAAGKEDAA